MILDEFAKNYFGGWASCAARLTTCMIIGMMIMISQFLRFL